MLSERCSTVQGEERARGQTPARRELICLRTGGAHSCTELGGAPGQLPAASAVPQLRFGFICLQSSHTARGTCLYLALTVRVQVVQNVTQGQLAAPWVP